MLGEFSASPVAEGPGLILVPELGSQKPCSTAKKKNECQAWLILVRGL